jgi:hypothetical protein
MNPTPADVHRPKPGDATLIDGDLFVVHSYTFEGGYPRKSVHTLIGHYAAKPKYTCTLDYRTWCKAAERYKGQDILAVITAFHADKPYAADMVNAIDLNHVTLRKPVLRTEKRQVQETVLRTIMRPVQVKVVRTVTRHVQVESIEEAQVDVRTLAPGASTPLDALEQAFAAYGVAPGDTYMPKRSNQSKGRPTKYVVIGFIDHLTLNVQAITGRDSQTRPLSLRQWRAWTAKAKPKQLRKQNG